MQDGFHKVRRSRLSAIVLLHNALKKNDPDKPE